MMKEKIIQLNHLFKYTLSLHNHLICNDNKQEEIKTYIESVTLLLALLQQLVVVDTRQHCSCFGEWMEIVHGENDENLLNRIGVVLADAHALYKQTIYYLNDLCYTKE